MEYKLGITKVIHWDKEGIYKIQPECHIQWLTTSEITDNLYKGRLMITLVAKPIVLENGVTIFSAIFNTKAFLTFANPEDPIVDIIKMWNKCYLQEIELFKESIKDVTDYINFSKLDYSAFDSAYNLRAILLQRNMVKLS